MDKIRDSFRRVKEDITYLYENLNFLASETYKIRQELAEIKGFLSDFTSTQTPNFSTDRHITSTDKGAFKPLKPQILGISTGNRGVSTDRQTLRQTDRQTQNTLEMEQRGRLDKSSKLSVDKAAEILDSLDNIKKEIRLKFKHLTEQEMLVFSALYQIEEEKGFADYRSISLKTGLTESSIRDYVGRILKKGIPVDKIKVNNKMIQLKISPNLRKIASLNTILSLRDL